MKPKFEVARFELIKIPRIEVVHWTAELLWPPLRGGEGGAIPPLQLCRTPLLDPAAHGKGGPVGVQERARGSLWMQ